jgi:transcriptional regulator with XRE-family HTH domain
MATETQKRAVATIFKALDQGWTVQSLADMLEISSAHISNVTSGERKPGRTLINSLIEAGWLDKPPPYPYFKIRRDNPESAAYRIVQRLGVSYAERLALNLCKYTEKESPID